MEQDDSSALSIRYCIGCTSLSSLAASFIFLLAKTIYLCRNKYFKIDLWHSSYFLLCHLIFKGNNCHLDSSFSALTMCRPLLQPPLVPTAAKPNQMTSISKMRGLQNGEVLQP